MNIWLDKNRFLGSYSDIEKIRLILKEWQETNPDKKLYLFEVNGVQYSFIDAWEELLVEHANSDLEVNLITASPDELLLELVGSTKEYLERLIIALPDLAAKFYTNPNQEAWQMLSDFIEGLHFVNKAMTLINSPGFNKEHFDTLTVELLQAMEEKDTVTIADTLNYEWSSWLSAIHKEYLQ